MVGGRGAGGSAGVSGMIKGRGGSDHTAVGGGGGTSGRVGLGWAITGGPPRTGLASSTPSTGGVNVEAEAPSPFISFPSGLGLAGPVFTEAASREGQAEALDKEAASLAPATPLQQPVDPAAPKPHPFLPLWL